MEVSLSCYTGVSCCGAREQKAAWDVCTLLDLGDKLASEICTIRLHFSIYEVQQVRGNFCFSLFDLIICVQDS